ncbi:hypothetical protein V7S43_007998 [Phytophthora oleae]|uniref:Uncharacterized protein n=1 Tax=Phytophthora oleae TaxID=2107226 RepID=A0ABD3FKU7_9STRA
MAELEHASSTSSSGWRQGGDRSLLDMMDEAQHRLQHLEISCRQILSPSDPSIPQKPQSPTSSDPKVLQFQVKHLQAQLLATVTRREEDDVAFRQAAMYATAKGSANGVLHALFGQVSSGKTAELKTYLGTGSVPTRDGLRHWKLDLRTIRNEAGSSLLHVAVAVSTAREKVKVKLVHLLVDRVGFDPNVRDVFGQTPLHIAAMGGFQQVIQALLERGANPIAQDRSGLTALSLVRTLSRPPEEVVRTLVDAESAAIRSICSSSKSIPLSKALASALFLKGLSRFALEQHSNAFTRQATALVNVLLEGNHEDSVDFDRLLHDHVPMLFDAVRASKVVRLETVFANTIYWDADFVNDLKLEADGYDMSLISPPLTAIPLVGPSWVGVLSKLIQGLKVEMAEPAQMSPQIDDESANATTSASFGEEVVMEQGNGIAAMTSPPRKWSISSSSLSVDPRSAQYYGDQTTFTAKNREIWYYAVLFKASTHAFPGTISLSPESNIAVASEDVSKYFPLEDSLLIGTAEYFVTNYDPQNRELKLDRNFDGKESATVKAYLTGACSSHQPPYVAVKRIWEREPGNKYEDQMSSEQELFQDYQFLDPESEYEVAIKLGPLSSGKEARAIVAEWKRTAKQLFDERKCTSELPCCEHYCPQRHGHSLVSVILQL